MYYQIKTINKMKTLKITIAALILTSSLTAQTIKENKTSVKINDVEIIKNTQSFNNLLELKDEHQTKTINLSYFNHAFKVVKTYNNKTIIKVNGMYKDAVKIKNYIKNLNKDINIIFI